jgi:hypothetical protein
MALNNDMDSRVRNNLAYGLHGAVPQPAIPGKERQNFGQNLFCCVDAALRQKTVESRDIFRISVRGIYQRNPIVLLGHKVSQSLCTVS